MKAVIHFMNKTIDIRRLPAKDILLPKELIVPEIKSILFEKSGYAIFTGDLPYGGKATIQISNLRHIKFEG